MVGVPSIFGSGARARVKCFISYFFHHGHAPYHSTKKGKKVWANSGARADPKVIPSQGRFSVGAQARVSRLLRFLDKNGFPWGQRASQIRVRARADYVLYCNLFEWYGQKEKEPTVPNKRKKRLGPRHLRARFGVGVTSELRFPV